MRRLKRFSQTRPAANPATAPATAARSDPAARNPQQTVFWNTDHHRFTDPGIDPVENAQPHMTVSQYPGKGRRTTALVCGAGTAGCRARALDPGVFAFHPDDLSRFFKHVFTLGACRTQDCRLTERAIIFTVAGGTSPTTVT
jgi:hypothetical protein